MKELGGLGSGSLSHPPQASCRGGMYLSPSKCVDEPVSVWFFSRML